MQELETFKLIERISAILRSEERKKYAAIGLQPVHGQVLDYLAKCNHYSNTHAAVAEYLGLTKGTVSQTIQILERRHYLEKTTDAVDGRVVHLTLTESGYALLEDLKPLDVFKHAETQLSEREFETIGQALRATLSVLQKVNNSKSFGLCRSCRHFAVEANHYHCGLTEQPLARGDTEKICRDHQPFSDPHQEE